MLMVKLLFLDSYDSTRPISALISPLPPAKPIEADHAGAESGDSKE